MEETPTAGPPPPIPVASRPGAVEFPPEPSAVGKRAKVLYDYDVSFELQAKKYLADDVLVQAAEDVSSESKGQY